MTADTSLVTKTDFICLPTQDYEKAKQFYGETLGMPFSKQWGDFPAGEYETGSLTIALMQTDAFGMDFVPHGAPVALHVEDVEAARKQLEGKGVSFEADTMDSGVCHMAYFRDPDGNSLMLHNRYAPPGTKPGDH